MFKQQINWIPSIYVNVEYMRGIFASWRSESVDISQVLLCFLQKFQLKVSIIQFHIINNLSLWFSG